MRTSTVFCALVLSPFLGAHGSELGQSAATAPSEALLLIQQVSQRYEKAKSYRIEAIEEQTQATELNRNWRKSFMTAIEGEGNRYRFEGRSDPGSAIVVSDGATEWRFHASDGLYTAKPIADAKPKPGRIIVEDEYVLMEARGLRKHIARLGKLLKSASWLKDETITVGGRRINCRVVRFDENDRKTKHDIGASEQRTLWIDKKRGVLVKSFEKSRASVRRRNGTSFRMDLERSIVYPVAELDQELPASVFAFAPPEGARLVADFPDPDAWVDPSADTFLDKPAPELRLKSADGTEQTLSSLRGKTVLLDFWATTCAPCVSALPELVKLHNEAKGTDLVIISIDSDDEPEKAAAVLKEKSAAWSNYHDSDATLGGAYKRMGIPLGVLIDREGKVVFYKSGYSVSELREALAKLGPEFASLAPQKKPKD